MEVVQVLQLGLMTMHLLLQMEFLCQTFKTDFMESITSDYMGFKKEKNQEQEIKNAILTSIYLLEMSFIPLDNVECPGQLESLELIPARKVAVSEILPLTLVGNQVNINNKQSVNKKKQ